MLQSFDLLSFDDELYKKRQEEIGLGILKGYYDEPKK